MGNSDLGLMGMESLFDKILRNKKRILRFVIVAVCVVVMAVVIPAVAITINGLPIADNDPQAMPPPDPPSETLFHALREVMLFPSSILDFLRMKAGIRPLGIMGGYFLLVLPGLFWAFFVELLFEAKKRLRPKKSPA
jgi:hypothetical protein